MTEEKRTIKLPHNVIMEDRKNLSVSGVSDIDRFDEQTIVVFTDMGELTIKGYDLHINKLNVDTGELTVEGDIYSLMYSDQEKKSTGLFTKIFK
ncbi:MAG: sporulation protein YabP [Oscillospiraceae bacterium]|jgi:sporulation protein YabP|nr:sporulation protein YabP [Oscillospiraceae bacterium]